jgi:hypothetical protein
MTFAYDTPPSAPVDVHQERRDNSAPAMHIEETPCIVMPAVAITPAVNVRLWRARIARAWMT